MAKKNAKKAEAPKLSLVDIKAKADAAIANRNNYEQAVAWSNDPSKTARERLEASNAAKHYETKLRAVEPAVVDSIVEAEEQAEADADAAKAKAEEEAAKAEADAAAEAKAKADAEAAAGN